MPGWYPRIKRGSTFRVPITLTDSVGFPTTFLDTDFVITPSDGSSPIVLNPANGKLLLTTFNYIGDWNATTTYQIGDVIKLTLGKINLWRAIQVNINHSPIAGSAGLYWEPFAQFVFLLSSSETASYQWRSGTYRWRRVYGNGDVKIKTGNIEVNG